MDEPNTPRRWVLLIAAIVLLVLLGILFTFSSVDTLDQRVMKPWYIEKLGYEAIWPSTKGAGIKIAVLDSGVANRSAFANAELTFRDATLDVADPVDTDGHGTRMVSLILSRDPEAPGMAVDAEVTVYAVFDSDGLANPDLVTAAIRHALAGGADIISCSFVLPRVQGELLVQLEAASNANVPIIVAAGNKANETNEFPEEHADRLVAVGGTETDFRALVGAKKGKFVRVFAPGRKLAVVPADGPVDTNEVGTSGAAAIVSATLALGLAAYLAAEPALSPSERAERRSTALAALEATAKSSKKLAVIHPTAALSHVNAGENADAEKKLKAAETLLEEYRSLLLETEPIEVVLVHLTGPALDNELRALCQDLGEVDVLKLACALHRDDCSAHAGRVSAAAFLSGHATDLGSAADAVASWDPTAPTAATVTAGRTAFADFVGALDKTRGLCTSMGQFPLSTVPMDEVRALADAETLATSRDILRVLKNPAKQDDLAEALKAANDADDEKARTALIEARSLLPRLAGGTPSSATSSALIGGKGQTIIEGLAEFLVTRAKEEAINYLRDVLVEELCGGDVRPFVRETCDVLETVEHTTALRAIGRSVVAAMEKDLRRLPDVGLVYASTSRHEFAYFGTATRVGIALLRASRDGINPVAFMRSIHVSAKIDCEATTRVLTGVPECRKTMALLRAASAMFYAIEQMESSRFDSYWVLGTLLAWEQRHEEMKRLGLDTPDVRRFFPSVIDNAVVVRVQTTLARVGKAAKAIEDVIATAVQDAEDGQVDASVLLAAAAAAVSATTDAAAAVRCAVDPSHCPSAPAPPAAEGLQFNFLGRSVSIGWGMTPPGGGPAAAARDPLDLGLAKSASPEISKLVVAVAAKDWANAAPAALDLLEKRGVATAMGDNWEVLSKFIPVLVEIGQADSSADVAATLEAAVPPGGYRSKYRQPMLAINGFVGGTFAYERYRAGPAQAPVNGASLALFAPVGLHIAGPVGSTRKKWALGGLLTALDLGAITARSVVESDVKPEPVGDDSDGDDGGIVETEVEAAPPLDIRQVFSPGAFFTVGIAESPASFGVGASYSPYLRQTTLTMPGDGVFEDERVEGELRGAWRIGLFVAVDVTLFAFRLSRG